MKIQSKIVKNQHFLKSLRMIQYLVKRDNYKSVILKKCKIGGSISSAAEMAALAQADEFFARTIRYQVETEVGCLQKYQSQNCQDKSDCVNAKSHC